MGEMEVLNVMFYCDFVTFPCGVLGQVWYLIVSIPDLCLLLTYISAHDLLNLLDKFRRRDKMRGLITIFCSRVIALSLKS